MMCIRKGKIKVNVPHLKYYFQTINKTPTLLKNWITAIFIQLTMLASIFIPILGCFIILAILIYWLGYFFTTIKNNVENENFIFTNWTDKEILKTGIKVFLSLLIFLIALYSAILLFTTICFIPLIPISNLLNNGEYIGWFALLIPMAITFYVIYPYLIITSPAIIADYINKNKLTSLLEFKDSFKLFKKDLKTSFTIFLYLLLLFPLCLIPIIGYYFSLVGTYILAQYTKFLRINTEKGKKYE